MTDVCVFCGDSRVLEQHHVIPRRFDGPDTDDNLVTVCPTCHRILERLYDKEFYEAVGAYEPSTDPYREGVIDALKLQLDISSDYLRKNPGPVPHRAIFEEAKNKAATELLPDDFRQCPACELPSRESPCEHCGTSRQRMVVGDE